MQKTVLILAGGKGQRFHSRDKCFIMLDGKPLIQRAIDNLWSAADEIIVAARDEQQGARISTTIPDKIALVFDPLKGVGPLAGILSGLERSSSSFSLIVGCDMPFVNKEVVEFLFAVAERGDYDAVVPRWENGMVEPLHAVYKREAMLAAVRDAIEHGDKKLFNVLSQLKNVEFLPINEIREINPELTTFRNINTPEELKKLRITG
ncbi:MAG TPA: molybdenum cofactor guanylyltransferase [Desulfobacteria bacterium]|nr:molybdenum cofactor guanylyltransferase [Desulfobacteria bacterium]